jgi:hypothetical protein
MAGAVRYRNLRRHPALDPPVRSFLDLDRVPVLVVSPVRCRAVRGDGECFTEASP